MLGKTTKADLPATLFGEDVSRVAGPRGRSRRPRCPSPRHGVDAAPWRGLDDRRQGLAPEGHRPGARRGAQLSHAHRRRRRLRARSRAATPSRSTARPAAGRCAPRSRCTPSATASRCSTPAASTSPRPRRPRRRSSKWGARGPTLVVLDSRGARAPQRSFRNIDRVDVAEATAVGVADVIGAASLVVSQTALEVLEAGRGADREPRRGRRSGRRTVSDGVAHR